MYNIYVKNTSSMTWQMNKVTVIGLIAMSFQIVNRLPDTEQ